jgi:glycosyltransferase involved in cell wall biosynthesis
MKILLLPDLRGTIGGPGTFQYLLATSLKKKGINIHYDLNCSYIDTLLLISATKHINLLLKLKKRGVKIVQRLGTPVDYLRLFPIPFIKRLKNFITISYIVWIRRYFADVVVYQSSFVSQEWSRLYGAVPNKKEYVIHNGVNTAEFKSDGDKYVSPSPVCIISVEGYQGVDPFNIALNLTSMLVSQGIDAELLMLGKPWGGVQERMVAYPFVRFIGHIERSKLPFYLRGADVFLFTDILSAGCPNSVLEALACGIPVIGHNCGVLKELIEGKAGICVDQDGDPWKGQNPGNIAGLSKAVQDIISNRDVYRSAARRLAVEKYSAELMVEKYCEILSK